MSPKTPCREVLNAVLIVTHLFPPCVCGGCGVWTERERGGGRGLERGPMCRREEGEKRAGLPGLTSWAVNSSHNMAMRPEPQSTQLQARSAQRCPH